MQRERAKLHSATGQRLATQVTVCRQKTSDEVAKRKDMLARAAIARVDECDRLEIAVPFFKHGSQLPCRDLPFRVEGKHRGA